jgi:hypothetical protein
MPVVSIDRTPAHPAPLLSHPAILPQRNARFCHDESACPVMRHAQNWNICVPGLHCSTPSVSRS